MVKEVIAPANVYKPRGFSHAFKAGNTIYVGAQGSTDEDYKLVGKGDFVRQTEQTYENLKRVLDAAGAKTSDIVKMTYYVINPEDLNKTSDVFLRYFHEPYPALTVIKVLGFFVPDVLIEVDAIAVVE